RVPNEGIDVMRLQSRLLLFSALLPLSLAAPFAGAALAQDHGAHADAGEAAAAPAAAARTVRWSDPAAWPEGRVPRAGDAVTIGRELEVVLDVDPPALRSLTIDGKLRFSDELD